MTILDFPAAIPFHNCMEYCTLGTTDIKVSLLCLGTMTWGEQNSEAESHAQIDLALAHGINFIDAAEMYPVPPRAETQGKTEEYLGTWLKKSGKRDKVILATKVTGRAESFGYLGRGETRLSREHLMQAVEGSLKRLQTEYIDLYQLHWPDRQVNNFGQLGYTHDPKDDPIPIFETLEVLSELVKQGKVRHIGLSNETPWGMMKFLEGAAAKGYPRIVSIQNPYSLLNRSFEVGLAEMAIKERCGLLAYSPLGFGMLTGKYLNSAMPAGSRLTIYSRFQRYNRPRGFAATERYVALAKQHGLIPAQMALAFITRQPFLTSAIIGATTLAQLEENIKSMEITLSEEVLKEIEEIQVDIPNPCP